jgi:uncharacterized protein YjbI with pentapeptide repeats
MFKQFGALLVSALLVGAVAPSAKALSNCSQEYNSYAGLGDVTNRDYLESQTLQRYLSCNTKNVPPSGTPSGIPETTYSPSIPKTAKCPKITSDIHGRKDFAGTTCLAGKMLAGFNMKDMDLTGASLRGSNLTGANLTGTRFSRTDFTSAIIDYAKVGSVDFSSADFSKVRANHMSGSPSRLPYGWKNFQGLLAGPKADLSRLYLRSANIHDVDLSYANLTDTRLDNATLSNVKLDYTKFTPKVSGLITKNLKGKPSTRDVLIVNGYLIAPGVNLKNADLSNANLTGADLSKVNLDWANLKGAKLEKAKLDYSHNNTYLRGVPASLPIGWYMQGNYLKRQ